MSKVKELLKDADICFLGYERNGCRDLIQMGLEKLHEAQKELSKSDWVSVEDGLPPYDESVLVTNKETPEIVLKTSRTKVNGWNTDNNGFLCAIAFTITHWKPIEKLEE